MISIIICTYNRASYVQDTLDSFYNIVEKNDISFEILIIDNNSTDNIREVTFNFKKIHPEEIYYFLETEQGLSAARNRGIKEARGDIIAFLDDDIYMYSTWLHAMYTTLQDHPEISCLGGKIIPLFEEGRPEWIDDSMLGIYGYQDYGNDLTKLDYPDYPFGGNVAYRKEIFQQFGGFNTNLGRKKNSLLSNEESEFFHRLSKADVYCAYTPNAAIEHRIPKSRTEKQWIINRLYWQAISSVVHTQLTNPLTKTQLFKKCVSSLFNALNATIGNSMSPKRIYWNMKSLSLQQNINMKRQLGIARQSWKEIFKTYG